MPTSSPKDRLSKLFHHSSKKDEVPSSPPPASPSSNRGVRKSTSRTSLRDVIHSRGRSGSKAAEQQYIPTDARQAVPTSQGRSPVSATYPPAQTAAVKAMYPDEELLNSRQGTGARSGEYNYLNPKTTSREAARLPDVPHQSDLSQDLRHMTTSDAVGRAQYSEDVADRNLDKRAGTIMGDSSSSSGFANGSPARSGNAKSSARGVNTPLVDGRSLTRKADNRNIRGSSDLDRPINTFGSVTRESLDGPRRSKDLKRSSLQKPLPTAPSSYAEGQSRNAVTAGELPDVHSALGKERGYLVKDAAKPVNLSSIVDLRNTEDTTLHEKWAPAVTHATIIQNEHHIREELITREIHNYHIFHRILPIVDIEVLPARHFVPVNGGYAEIAEEEVPGQAGVNAQWIIAETMSKLMPESKGSIVPPHFTARKFAGTDGDYKESVATLGHKVTEQWWVHPPTIEDGGKRTGQTYAFHIGSADPRDDGLRANLPVGNVIGVSPLLAQQQRQRLQMESQGGGGGGVSTSQPRQLAGEAAPPPVPSHKLFPAELVDKSRAVGGQTKRPNVSHGFSYEM